MNALLEKILNVFLGVYKEVRGLFSDKLLALFLVWLWFKKIIGHAPTT